jgi:hypothetical protein
MKARLALIAGLAGLSAACTTTEPACREATAAERALFGAIVAHNEAGAADMMAATPQAERLRALDPAIEAQVFGARMGEPSVRTVLMQPPLCLYDEALSGTERVTYIFPAGRFEQLQNPDIPGAELGRAGLDHAACRFVSENGQWRLSDACLSTFAAQSPAS